MLAALIPLLAQIPSIVKCFTGDEAKDKGIGEKMLDAVETVTGTRDANSAASILAKNPELVMQLEAKVEEVNLAYAKELTKRHEADMASDSWMSKNVRPLCLMGLTIAIMVGVWLPDNLVSATRFTALTDMSQWVYGYYFVGRSSEKTGGLSGLTGLFSRKR
ncbi:hypothetical protein ACR42D_10755 [Desulfovibrio caledoniensis]